MKTLSAATVALVALGSMTACGPSLRAIEEHNRRARTDAEAATRAAGSVFEPPRVEVDPAHDVASAGSHGLEQGEWLYADASGQLVLVAAACAVRARCGDDCERPVEYSFHRARDGRVVIVRSRVVLEEVRTEDDPNCPALCGGGAPRFGSAAVRGALSGAGLGVTELDRVELRTVTYAEQIVRRVCTNTTPIP